MRHATTHATPTEGQRVWPPCQPVGTCGTAGQQGVGPQGVECVNCFALVAYIPEALGEYLDRLRQTLVPGCFFRSHVTVLPPRPITAAWPDALAQIEAHAVSAPAFELTLGTVQVFPRTSVVYLSVESGERELSAMHEAMNSDALAFEEPFAFHPHVTLAQDFPPEHLDEVRDLAQRGWAECRHARRFAVDRLAFVQRTVENTWVHLAECRLPAPVR